MTKKKTDKDKKKKRPAKKDIAKAVDQIPAMIAKEAKKERPKVARSKKEEEKTHAHHFAYEHHHVHPKRRLLWFGVACLTIIVIAMWALNARVFLYQLSAQSESLRSSELLDQAKDDFQEVLDTINQRKEEEKATRAAVEQQIEDAEAERNVERGITTVIANEIVKAKVNETSE